MADFAGLAFAALVEVNHIAQAIYRTWQSARQFGGDAAALHTRFSASQISLKAYERVLFDAGRFPSVSGRLIDHLPVEVCQSLVEMLYELQVVFDRYLTVTKTYHVGNETDGTAAFDPVIGEEERAQTVLALGLSRAEEQARSVGLLRRTWWAMWDKKNVEKLVREFERWTKRARLLIESAWWPLPLFASTANLESLRNDESAIQAGLTDDIELRKLVLAHVDSLDYIRTLETKGNLQKIKSVGEATYGSLDGQTVLIEYQEYETDHGTDSMDERITARIMRLVALMHEANDARFNVMKCTNYMDDKLAKKFGFVFALPPLLSANPNTLLTHLNCRPSSRPNLTTRIKLAHTLAETLHLLHSVGWVHKSLRSDKILFLRAAEPQNQGQTTTEPKTDALDLNSPRIFGFEFSRLESDSTSLRADLEIRRNIYRHPDRWGQPTQAFSKVHDIYGSITILPFSLTKTLPITYESNHKHEQLSE